MQDAPDDFDYSNIGEFTANLDSSELAARLYSPALYARKGQVLFLTDFTRGFSGLYNTVDSADAEVRLISRYYSQSGLSVYIKNKSTNANNGYVSTALPLVVARYYTIDVRYELYGTNAKFRIAFAEAIDSEYNNVAFIHTSSPTKIEINTKDSDAYDITELSDRALSLSSRNHVSITIDTQDRVYKELYLSGSKFAVAGIELNQFDDGVSEEITFNLYSVGDGTNYSYLVIHSIVVSASDI